MMNTFESLPGGITLQTGPGAFALSTDSMVLADFVRLPRNATVCDLGCGSGALMLLLCAKRPDCTVTGVEVQPGACALAAQNITNNHLEHRARLVSGDLRQTEVLLPAGSFTQVVANPPYFPTSIPMAPSPARAAARGETACSLENLCRAAAWLLRWGGTFSLVYRPERLCDLVCALRAAGLEPKRLRFVRHSPSKSVSLLLLEAKRGGKPGLQLEPDLLLHDADGQPTADYRRIYHQEGDV
jgi:tRNA1Val (adenine37-N6)-methyltransferase